MTGLTNEQVQERIAEGKVNVNENPNTRTYKQIILENTLTFFNFLNIALLVLVLFVRSYKNSMFMGIILINTVIGIIQEIRAKKTIDKLAILTESKTVVLREGKKWSISTEKLVLDDLIFLKTGDQVPADVKVLEGTVEVNESLLTGESDNLSKSQGDELFSGSFVTSGEACCQVIHVGKDNYASQITSEAKEFKRHNSELRNSLNAILKVISIIIVPLGAMLFYKQYMIVGDTLKDSVVNMVAAVLGMIPEGLVLLTSVALTLGSMVLATKKTLVQELYCIETLARVDTLCLDKTGTITEGTMKVEDVQLYDTAQTTVVQHTAKFDPETGEPVQNVSALKPEVTVSAEKENGQIQETVNLETVSQEERQKLQEIDHIMGNMMSVLHDQNATADALRKRFPSRNDLKLIHAIPFSSDRKYSGAVFEGRGTYLMGAAQFLFPEGNEELLEHCSSYAQEGYRILVLAHSEQETKGTERPTGLEPLGLFLITDVIREEAPDTLAFFDSQGVDLKVISGDDPVTVSAIAKKAGLKNANHYIDATTIKTPEEMQRAVAECSVFGRVTPQQKKQMVQALQSQKHTVAMTGDGVNDVLALKEADCSIAMAAGSDAAKQAAESTAVLPVLNTIQLKSDLVNLIGEERIERSILNGGTSAISCWKSYWIPGTEEINVVIEYKIKIPVPLLKSPSVKLKDEFKVSAWNGYQKDRKGNEDGQIVYITEKGTVWHSDYQCSYLQLSIQYVQYSELQNMRNEGGRKYHKCEQCVYGKAMNGVYITSYGNRYHNSLNCSSLKRTIRAVHKSEVAGRGGCSKCAK